jgi:hypothetical protein
MGVADATDPPEPTPWRILSALPFVLEEATHSREESRPVTDRAFPKPLQEELQPAWGHYADYLAPHRPALHRYCVRLTGNLWDGEDLLQDTVVRRRRSTAGADGSRRGMSEPPARRPRASSSTASSPPSTPAT